MVGHIFSLVLIFRVFLWLFAGWFLFLVFIFMSGDSSFSNQEHILTLLLCFWPIIKFYHWFYGSVTLYHVILLNYVIVNYLISESHYYLFIIVFLILFLISFSLPYYLTLCCICYQSRIWVSLFTITFIIIFPARSFEPKM